MLREATSMMSISPTIADDFKGSEPASRSQTRMLGPRRGSSISRVGDATGIEELGQVSQTSTHSILSISKKNQNPESVASSITLTGLKLDKDLDLEKTVRYIMKK